MNTILELSELFEFHGDEDINAPDWWALKNDDRIVILIHAEQERPYHVMQKTLNADGSIATAEFHGPFRTLRGAQSKALTLAEPVRS